MLQIDDKVISFDILQKKFSCDLKKCKGACCVHGDSGAPLEDKETEILKNIYPLVKPFMRQEGIEAVEQQGTHVIDSDGDKVTPLVNGKECSYVVFEDGIAFCAIEKAYIAKAIDFQKPISCHLYPIRVTKYKGFEAVNYHCWDICKHALTKGRKTETSLFVFLKEPLVRNYGSDWFEKLKIANDEYVKFKM